MSGKRPSLAESMRATAAEPAAPPAQPAPVTETTGARPNGFFAATRAGKKKATVPLSDAAHRQLKGLAVDQGGKLEGLLTEAVNDLFRKYGKPPIA